MKAKINWELVTLGVLFFALIWVLAGCKRSAVPYHQKLQKEATYENRLDKVESFTLKSLKESEKDLKDKLAELRKRNKEHSEMRRIESRLDELRKEIEELEKNE